MALSEAKKAKADAAESSEENIKALKQQLKEHKDKIFQLEKIHETRQEDKRKGGFQVEQEFPYAQRARMWNAARGDQFNENRGFRP